MRTIMIANPKGGSGKSTLAVHLASWFARCDEVVYLGDLDRQQSSRYWLDARPIAHPKIYHWAIDPDNLGIPPKNGSMAILDTPAGLHGKRLKQLLEIVDQIIVPVLPSRFDIRASQDFFEALAETKAVRKERVGVAIVGMRMDLRTHASQQLISSLQQFDLPLLTCLRNAQRYVQAIESGTTLFDSHKTLSSADRIQWQPLLDWVASRG